MSTNKNQSVQKTINQKYPLISPTPVLGAANQGYIEPVTSWNSLCWWGSLLGRVADVIDACERAVELAPDQGGIRDSRGLARVLIGDYDGAIEDFKFYFESP